MRKIIGLLLISILLFTISACGSRQGHTPGTAYIDDCYINITSCETVYDSYAGDVFVVHVDFENNSKMAKSMFFTARIEAYQNGVKLSRPSKWWPYQHGIKDDTTEILPGNKISTGYGFEARGNSPILVRICDGNKVISEKEYNP